MPAATRIHVLGFAKADEIESFAPFRITSFDTTSPLIRAFKDAKANYYMPGADGRLKYYTAIRVPQALENPKLVRLAKRGVLNQEELVRLERSALQALRAYDRDEAELEETLEAVLTYAAPAALGATLDQMPGSSKVSDLRERYRRTLADQPWKNCACAICQALSIEVMIFRASNRNKRRGIHNVGVYKALVDRLPERNQDVEHAGISSDQGGPEPVPQGGVVRGARLGSEAVC